jgi:hypothetical protein
MEHGARAMNYPPAFTGFGWCGSCRNHDAYEVKVGAHEVIFGAGEVKKLGAEEVSGLVLES